MRSNTPEEGQQEAAMRQVLIRPRGIQTHHRDPLFGTGSAAVGACWIGCAFRAAGGPLQLFSAHLSHGVVEAVVICGCRQEDEVQFVF